MFIFSQLTAIISNVYIENGAFISEQIRDGIRTGSTIRLVLYCGIFFIAADFIFGLFKPRLCAFANMHIKGLSIQSSKSAILLVRTITIIVLGLLITGVFLVGNALSLGVDRFSYRMDHPYPLLIALQYKLIFLCPLLGISFSRNKKNKVWWENIDFGLFFLILLIHILYGEKFSGLLLSAFMFFLPSLIIMGLQNYYLKISLKFLFLASFVVITSYNLVAYHYREIYGNLDVGKMIISRIFGLQGHVWWGVDEAISGIMPNINLQETIRTIFLQSTPERPTGLYSLMYFISPEKIVSAYIDNNIRFSMGSPAIAVYAFGYAGAVLYQAISGLIVGWFGYYFAKKFVATQYIRVFLSSIIFMALIEAFIMGNPPIFFTFYNIKYVIALLFVESTAKFAAILSQRHKTLIKKDNKALHDSASDVLLVNTLK